MKTTYSKECLMNLIGIEIMFTPLQWGLGITAGYMSDGCIFQLFIGPFSLEIF